MITINYSYRSASIGFKRDARRIRLEKRLVQQWVEEEGYGRLCSGPDVF